MGTESEVAPNVGHEHSEEETNDPANRQQITRGTTRRTEEKANFEEWQISDTQ
jgi:hypothetical protein